MRGKLDSHPARVAWLIAAGLIMAMVGVGCGGGDDSGDGGSELQSVGKGEGKLDLAGWAVEDVARTRSGGEAIREADRVPDQRQGRRYLG